MIHEILAVGELQCNCSILGDEVSREAIVVDPGAEIARLQFVLAKHRLTVKHIVITHAHIDHIAGAARLKAATGAPILYNQRDLPLVAIMDRQAAWLGLAEASVPPPDADLPDLSQVSVAGITAHALLTPGHTPGSISLYIPTEKLVIVGDTLFAGGIGRTDWPGGDAPTLVRSIRERLLTLPGTTVVLPGHGPTTTVGAELEHNPFL